jgi:dihydroorotate dehydrogenase
MGKFNSLIIKYLHKLPPEFAHRIAITALKSMPPWRTKITSSKLEVNILNMKFPNPVGLAAGFDKNAEATQELLNFGFGFVEVGTITPKPQYGNRKPRLFRLSEDLSIINRMGFNNVGSKIAAMQIVLNKINGIYGVNIGPNNFSNDYMNCYVECIKTFAPMARYIVLNLSSPNTNGVRELQERDVLSQLLFWVINTRNKTKSNCPILIKISPDISISQLDDIVDVCLFRSIDGIIIANTTISFNKDSLISKFSNEQGGLSGPLLHNNVTNMLAHAYMRIKKHNSNLILIGSGGITDGKTAIEQIKAGANLVQIYTSFIYQGPEVIKKINNELINLMDNYTVNNISELVGIDAERICNDREVEY